MTRTSLLACGLAVIFADAARPAPAAKTTDKPEAPASAVERLKTSNNLKQIGLALHNYHDTFGRMPANLMTKDGKPGLARRVQILPFVEGDELYKQFKLDEAWNSEANKKLIEKMPKLFAPIRGKADGGQTYYQMFAGAGTLLDSEGKGITFPGVTDGLSNTFMTTEGDKPVTWTEPTDIPFDGKAAPKLGGQFGGEFHVLMGDGSVRRMPKGLDAAAIIGAIGRADGLSVDLDEAVKKALKKE